MSARVHAYPCSISLTLGAGGRRFKSGRPDCFAGGVIKPLASSKPSRSCSDAGIQGTRSQQLQEPSNGTVWGGPHTNRTRVV
jgi:hypothetical protein